MAPLVSICMPVWNGERFIEAAIKSALEQTVSDLELIVVDDCSSDQSIDIIKHFVGTDKRVQLYRNDHRLGLFNNYNKCISLAKGKYIKPFAQDDVLHSTNLEKLLLLFKEHSQIALASCARKWIDENGKLLQPALNAADVLPSLEPITRLEVLQRSMLPINNLIGEPAAVLFEKRIAGNGFDARFQHIGDLEYWLRLLQDGAFICTSEQLCSIRQHGARQTVKNNANLSSARDYLALTKKFGMELGYSPTDLLDSAVAEIGLHINQMISLGKLPLFPDIASNSEMIGESFSDTSYFELAFHSLRLLGRTNASKRLRTSVRTNERHIRRRERYLNKLLADPGWKYTRLLREISRLLKLQKDYAEIKEIKPTSKNDYYNAATLKRQQAYLFYLKKTALLVKRSRSWKVRNKVLSIFEKNKSTHKEYNPLLKDLANLPYLQDAFALEPKILSSLASDLIKESMYENLAKAEPKISVLICACNDKAGETIKALNQQNLAKDDFEVILIDSFNSEQFKSDIENTLKNNKLDLNLRVLRTKIAGRSAGHNLGLKLARSNLVVFLAGDFIPKENFIQTHLNFHLRHPDKRMVGIGAGLFNEELRHLEFRTWLEDSGNLFGVSFTEPNIQADFFYVGNSSVKKELLVEAGYFDEDFPSDAWDDYEMGLRLARFGMRAKLLSDDAHCLHQHPITFRARYNMMKEAAHNALIFDCKYPGPHPWHSHFRLSPSEHKQKAVIHLKEYRASRNRAEKYNYWQKLLTAAFVESYTEKAKTFLQPGKNELVKATSAVITEGTITGAKAEASSIHIDKYQKNAIAGQASLQVVEPLLFKNKILIVGFGSVGQGILPLLLKHLHIHPEQIVIIAADAEGQKEARDYGVELLVRALTRETYQQTLELYLNKGDLLLNLAVAVSSLDLIKWCQEKGILYLDTSMEPWPGGFTDPSLTLSQRSIYAQRERILALRSQYPNGITALVNHGANPGLISHFAKQALLNVAQDMELSIDKPNSRLAWAELAQKLGVKVMHIAERDSQTPTQAKRPGEFVNTWSVDGFYVEAIQPAELGWGTHEENCPADGEEHTFGSKAAIYLNRISASTRVRSWTPLEGTYQGFLISHAESISIADYFTVKENNVVRYRPTCLYAYHPCDDTVLSLHELASKNWQLQNNKRLIMDEITKGVDELGILLMGFGEKVYWYGSRLSIGQARSLVPYNNATSLQVAAGVFAGIMWLLKNQSAGIVEPEDIDHEYILSTARPYLGEVIGAYGDWAPVNDRNKLFKEDLAQCPWQFKNFRVV